ncbi:metallophosphoesterase [Gammaproteobacteria bacterium]|nr:metallophosphoesterase [Gammaproteobacteria bacterium]
MKLIFLIILFFLTAGILYKNNRAHLYPEMNAVTLEIPQILNTNMGRGNIRIAIMGDLHVKQSSVAYEELSALLESILASEPEMIFLLGDYTKSGHLISDMEAHRTEVAKRLSALTRLPVSAVLGNYETLSGPDDWNNALSAAGISVLHNAIKTLNIKGRKFCIRGLGDAYTKQFRHVDFPQHCADAAKITLTHDPAGALKTGISGLIFAAHTHCGQIRLPVLGALWTPTEAPQSATCGLYEDNTRMLWVTAGVGTSVFPVRLGAQSQWDLITLK